MRLILTLIIFLVPWLTVAQNSEEPGNLLEDLQILSADDMEGRKTGTRGNAKARKYIVSRFESIGVSPFDGEYLREFEIPENISIKSRRGYNIIGYLPGASEKGIVISAHYDHLGIKNKQVFNGSDDNASGVAVLLFIASKIKDLNLKHTVIFVAFDAEEQGLLGAHSFIKNPPIPIERIVFNLNMDMVSKNKSDELYASGTYHYPKLKEDVRLWRDEYPIKIRMGHDNPGDPGNDWTNSSDHAAFHKRGIPYLYFGVEDHADYHKATDTYDKTDFKFFSKVAEILTDFVLKLDQKDLREFSNN